MGGWEGGGVGGWEGGGVGGGGGWVAEGGVSTHSDSKSSGLPSVSDLDWYNPQGRPRLP